MSMRFLSVFLLVWQVELTEGQLLTYDMMKLRQVNYTWLEIGFTHLNGENWVAITSSISGFRDPVVFLSVPTSTVLNTEVWAPRIKNIHINSDSHVTLDAKIYQPNESDCVNPFYVPSLGFTSKVMWMIAERGAFEVSGELFVIWSGDIVHPHPVPSSDANLIRIAYPDGCPTLRHGVCTFPEVTVGVVSQLQTLTHDRFLQVRATFVARSFARFYLTPHDSQQTNFSVITEPETLAFMAFRAGASCLCGDGVALETRLLTNMTDKPVKVPFLQEYQGAPGVFGIVSSLYGLDPVGIRTFAPTSQETNVKMQEDICADNETRHSNSERVSIFVIGEVLQDDDQAAIGRCHIVYNYTVTDTPTLAPSSIPSSIPTLSPTPQPTSSPTPIPTVKPTTIPSHMPSMWPTVPPTATPTSSPSQQPSQIPTVTPTDSPTKDPTISPTLLPTGNPTVIPTSQPTDSPTITPTISPTEGPTNRPTLSPTCSPTVSPTFQPTETPTIAPTISPTEGPTYGPTLSPTCSPTVLPTFQPTEVPTNAPTISPTGGPTCDPTQLPSSSPTVSPTFTATTQPTVTPTSLPTSPSACPTGTPSWVTGYPSSSSSGVPSQFPSGFPTSSAPTPSPTVSPTISPSCHPTALPTVIPTAWPSIVPSLHPSFQPSHSPSSTLRPSLDPDVPQPLRGLTGDAKALCSLVNSTNVGNIVANRGLSGWQCHSDESVLRMCSAWYGVSCVDGKIKSVNMAGLGITGFILDAFGGMEDLVRLNLSRNEIRGPLPANFSNMQKLELLNLSGNLLGLGQEESRNVRAVLRLREGVRRRLSSALSDAQVLSLLPVLSVLDISSNGYTGPIPTSLCNIPLNTLILNSPDAEPDSGTANAFSCMPSCLAAVDNIVGGDNMPLCEAVGPTLSPTKEVLSTRSTTSATIKASSLYVYIIPVLVVICCICCCIGYCCLCVSSDDKEKDKEKDIDIDMDIDLEKDVEACESNELVDVSTHDKLVAGNSQESVDGVERDTDKDTYMERDKDKDTYMDRDEDKDTYMDTDKDTYDGTDKDTYIGTEKCNATHMCNDVDNQSIDKDTARANPGRIPEPVRGFHLSELARNYHGSKGSGDNGDSVGFRLGWDEDETKHEGMLFDIDEDMGDMVHLSDDEYYPSGIGSDCDDSSNDGDGNSDPGDARSSDDGDGEAIASRMALRSAVQTPFGRSFQILRPTSIEDASEQAAHSSPSLIHRSMISHENSEDIPSLALRDILSLRLRTGGSACSSETNSVNSKSTRRSRISVASAASLRALASQISREKNDSPLVNMVSLSDAQGSKPCVQSPHDTDPDNASSAADEAPMMFEPADFSSMDNGMSGEDYLLNAVVAGVESPRARPFAPPTGDVLCGTINRAGSDGDGESIVLA